MTEEIVSSGVPMLVLTGLEGNAPAALSGLQLYIAPHYETLRIAWIVIAVTTLSFVVFSMIYKNTRAFPHEHA